MTVINVPEQARLGRSPNGANAIRNEWWGQMGANDTDQNTTQAGYGYANSQTGANAPQAQEGDVPNSSRVRFRGRTIGGQPQGLTGLAESGASGNQNRAIGLAGSMAQGLGMSPAQQQLQAGTQAAQAQQTAMARGARGSGALAVAGANAGANRANIGQQGAAQGQILRANEMAFGRGLYGSLLGQAQDQAQYRLGQNTQMQQQNAQLRDQYALGMGNAAVGIGNSQVGQGAIDRGYYAGGMEAINAQTDADQARQRWLAEAQKQKVAANMEDL